MQEKHIIYKSNLVFLFNYLPYDLIVTYKFFSHTQFSV